MSFEQTGLMSGGEAFLNLTIDARPRGLATGYGMVTVSIHSRVSGGNRDLFDARIYQVVRLECIGRCGEWERN